MKDFEYAALQEIGRCKAIFLKEIAEEEMQFFPEEVEVKWNCKGTAAGWAHYPSLIRLNKIYAEQEGESYLKTVAHEFAHICCYFCRDRRIAFKGQTDYSSHGFVWQEIFRSFGFNPDRTHSYDVEEIKSEANYIVYQCRCPGRLWQISPRMQTQMNRGRRYKCQRCGALLSLILPDEI
jgi:predicted SprT family Zn-dependent metalloprotease